MAADREALQAQAPPWRQGLPLLPAAYADHYTECEAPGTPIAVLNPHTGSTSSGYGSAGGIPSSGTYYTGDTLVFSFTPVLRGFTNDMVHTKLALALDGGVVRFATYTSHSTWWVYYDYTVQEGDSSSDLAYESRAALYWHTDSGNVRNSESEYFNCWLAAPGTGNSLDVVRDIVIDGTSKPVAKNASAADGAYGAGDRILVAVGFSVPAVVYPGGPGAALPTLLLDAGGRAARAAEYVSGNNTNSLVFGYTVQPGDRTDDLDYYSLYANQAPQCPNDSRNGGRFQRLAQLP